ncbi:unnamed protein product [Rhizoctonia solani]|uniref:Uncharacterized protein n=1 Tax=Rhizoctonia solani TaxID=456999 RepID=A0A8H3B3U3_9AGAM|nr:unnamed protein product [Rhizoctonia solani]
MKQYRDAELMLYTDQSSHIHFAACGIHQKAIEENGRGLFTTELLKKIRQNGVDKITYHNLLRSLSLPTEQSPQCYGKYKDRVLFNSRVSSHNTTFIHAEYDPEDDSWILQAGAASGVTLESIWELHHSPTEDSVPVGRCKVKQLNGSNAMLDPFDPKSILPGTGNRILYARFKQHGSGDDLVLKVWASPEVQDLLFPGPDQHVGSTHASGVGYKIISARDTADVALEIHHLESMKVEVAFYWYDLVSKKYGVEKLEHRKPAIRKEVEVVLFAAAHWRWHLQRTNASNAQNMTMSLLKVATRMRPKAPRDYLKEPESVVMKDGVAQLVVESTALHGLKLQNNVNSPLYVRLFYFDPNNFSIGDMFGHNAGNGEVPPNITPRGQLLIGDGADGGSPLKFGISSSNEVELGYMKVFWSTEPLELDEMKQKSAFQLGLGEFRGINLDSDSSDSKWGTECLAVVFRREHSS